jgi:hypothetical protein
LRWGLSRRMGNFYLTHERGELLWTQKISPQVLTMVMDARQLLNPRLWL